MAKLTISDAARACSVARSTLQRAVNAGRLSIDTDHRVDTAELLRAGYTLHAARQGKVCSTRQDTLQDAAPRASSTRQDAAGLAAGETPLLQQMIAALERENALLRAALDAAGAREQEAQVNAQAARDERTLLLHMLQDMQHRYDRLLEAPRTPPGPSPPSQRMPIRDDLPRGEMRRRIMALLQEHPERLSPAQVRQALGAARPLANTMLAMVRDGLIQRLGHGCYGALPARSPGP